MDDQPNNQQMPDQAAAEPNPGTQSTPAPMATPMASMPQAAPAAPAAEQPAAQPAAAPAPEAPAPEAISTQPTACKCPVIDAAKWDGQKMMLDKTFYKAFSPRLFNVPFSFAIDIDRANRGAKKKGYTVVENPMILDTMGMFMATVMVEVTGADTNDKNVISLAGKEVYTKLSKRPYKDIKMDIADLEKELGRKPAELYVWWVSCPKCVKDKEIKAILIAV